jgi:hypothetical protein
MNTDLKPCPFCGAEAELTAMNSRRYAYARVECQHCHTGMYADTCEKPGAKLPALIEEIVERWNHREEPKPGDEA